MLTRLMVSTFFVQILIFASFGQTHAACINPPLSSHDVSDFKSNPQALVLPDADTRTIEGTVRDLAASDATLASDLVALAKGATPRFQGAIAAGLAQAAVACSTVDERAAQLIQEAVASFEDGQFQAAFAAVAGDLSTAATEAAFSSAESSVGSVVVTNPAANTASAPAFGGGGSANVSAIVVLSSPILLTTSSTTAANPVSATR